MENLENDKQLTQLEGQATRNALAKTIKAPRKKVKLKRDMYSYIGKDMVVYPSWVSGKGRKIYWMAVLLSTVIVKYYMAFFGVWVGVFIVQMFGSQSLLNAYAIMSFIGLGCLLVYKALEGVNAANQASNDTIIGASSDDS